MERMLKVSVADDRNPIEVSFSGAIGESSELSAEGLPAGRRVLLDVAGIHSINSMGVRTWTNFVHELCAKSEQVIIRRLPPRMVTQAGMVKNFLGTAVVESFYAPYCCPDCTHEQLSLFTAWAEIPDEQTCPKCGEQMSFDDLRESYLAFRLDASEAAELLGDTGQLEAAIQVKDKEDSTNPPSFLTE